MQTTPANDNPYRHKHPAMAYQTNIDAVIEELNAWRERLCQMKYAGWNISGGATGANAKDEINSDLEGIQEGISIALNTIDKWLGENQ